MLSANHASSNRPQMSIRIGQLSEDDARFLVKFCLLIGHKNLPYFPLTKRVFMWQQVKVSIILLYMQSKAFCNYCLEIVSKPFYRHFPVCMSTLAISLNIDLNVWLFLTRSFHNKILTLTMHLASCMLSKVP